MGQTGCSSNHAVVMEELGMAAIFNDRAGDREEDELVEGSVGGVSGLNNIKSATSHQVDHLAKTLNEVVKKLESHGRIGSDKSSKKVIAEKVAKINRINQQAILKALALD